MERSVVLLMAFSLVLLGVSYYIGYKKDDEKFFRLARVSCLLLTFFLIPALAVVLFFQSTAKDRLLGVGFTPYPGITESVGISFGIGENPIWMFKIKGSDKVEEFYSYESNRHGWKLIEENEYTQTYGKGDEKMVIGGHKGLTSDSIIYMLEKK